MLLAVAVFGTRKISVDRGENLSYNDSIDLEIGPLSLLFTFFCGKTVE
jgi:hypothetical protein